MFTLNNAATRATLPKSKLDYYGEAAKPLELQFAPDALLIELSVTIERQLDYWRRMRRKVKRELDRRKAGRAL